MTFSLNQRHAARREQLRHSPYQSRATGTKTVKTAADGDWTIEITTRLVGTTLRRESVSVAVSNPTRCLEKTFSGFRTTAQADKAARDYIAKIERFHPQSSSSMPKPSKRLRAYLRRRKSGKG